MTGFDELVARYSQEGAVCVRNAVDRNRATELLSSLDELSATTEDRWTTNRIGGFSDRQLWRRFDWMYEFCARSELPALAGRLMQSSTARLFFDHTFVREAHTEHFTPWHQDRPYWPFQGRQIASVWVALTPCGPESSGLRFVKGSHAWNRTFQPLPFGAESASAAFLSEEKTAEPMPDFDAEPSRWEFLEWELEPGDAIVFSAEAIHGSRENTGSDRRRAAISVRYVGDDARWDPRSGTDPIVTAEQVAVKPGEPPHDDDYFPLVWSEPSRHDRIARQEPDH